MTRQRRWQLKMNAQGRCAKCGKKADGKLCNDHRKKSRIAAASRRNS